MCPLSSQDDGFVKAPLTPTQTDDILELLNTNDGRYAAACSLDFKNAPTFYDTFALRDSDGHEAIMSTWPYFRSSVSRHAMMRNEAVPVSSCWNGAGEPVPAESLSGRLTLIAQTVSMAVEPFLAEYPLRFRGVPDSLAAYHLEGSECCLIHADNPLSADLGVWLNPRVRVTYNGQAYEDTHDKSGGSWISLWGVIRGLWLNRLLRWIGWLQVEWWETMGRVNAWKIDGTAKGQSRSEPGGFCLIDEMQVLVVNGWAHV